MNTGFTPAIIVVSILAAVHLAAAAFPSGLVWGFHFLAYLGPAYAAGYAILACCLVAAGWKGRLAPALDRMSAASARGGLLFPAAALAAFVAAGFVFRVEVPLLGDSWYLVKNFSDALRGADELLPRDEPLATYYHSAVIGISGVATYGEFLRAFFTGGMLLGAGFLLTAYATTGLLFSEPRTRVVSFILICSLPCMVLFFGYVETYGVVLFALSLYALAGVLYMRQRVPFAVAALAFLVQALTHYLTILTLPSLVYLGYLGVRRGKGRDVALGAAVSLAAMLLVLAAVGFDVTKYFSQVPHKHYLPLATPEDSFERYSSPYTLFSPFHFLDLLNLSLLLLAPAAALLVALRPWRKTPSGPRAKGGAHVEPPGGFLAGMSRPEVFLLASMIPVALFAFVAKFDLGTARDWDVTGPYSYLFVLFALAAFFRRSSAGAHAVNAVCVIAGITILNSILWWTVTGSETAAVERFRSLMDPRLTGQAGMYSANLYLSRFFRQTGVGERESAELWLKYIEQYPGDIRGFRNVLVNSRGLGAAASAGMIREWSRAFGRNPVTDRTMVTLALESGNAALDENRDADAREFYRAAVDVDPLSAAGWNNLGTVAARGEQFAEAEEMFSRAVGIDPAFADAWFNLGRTRLATGKSAEARGAFAESARLGNRAAQSLLSTGNVQP